MPVILFNKPFGVLCQFTDSEVSSTTLPARKTLADFIDQPGFYAAGRLDRDSEGLLILTDDGKLQHRISHPRHKLPKTYVVQVEGDIDSIAIEALRDGVALKDGRTAKAQAKRVNEPAWLWPRTPPIRERRLNPVSWIELTLREGKNRQIRRMTAATGFPTLRLIRTRIGSWPLNGIASGEWMFSNTPSGPST